MKQRLQSAYKIKNLRYERLNCHKLSVAQQRWTVSYRYTDGLTVSNELWKNESKKKGSSLGGSFMAVGINNALFQTGQNHINRKTKKDKA